MRQNRAIIHDVAPRADTQGFAHVVVSDQDADTAFSQMLNDSLYVDDRDWIHASEGFIQS